MKIGNITIKEKTVLAPMYLITDLPFRILCRKNGAGLVYSEMISSKALVMKNTKSLEMAKVVKSEEPVAVQIFGDNPKTMADAAKILEKMGASIIDLNFGCPAKDIVEVGAGASLLKNPKKIEAIVKSVSSAVSIPVTAKIRIGIKNSTRINDSKKNIENSVKLAKLIEKAGASAIAVHGRTLEQQYSGKADWNAIKIIKKAVSIPVIGNGDVKSEEDAARMLSETGCDAVMIGRAAIGNPFIFGRINHYLKTGKKEKELSKKEKISAFFDYAKLAEKHGILTIQKAKTQGLWFTKGLFGSARLREKMSQARTIEEIEREMKDFLEL